MSDIKTIQINSETQEISLWKILLESGIAKAGGESNRLIKQSVIKVNGDIVNNTKKCYLKDETLLVQCLSETYIINIK